MHIFYVSKGCEEFEGEVFKGIALKDRTDIQYFFPSLGSVDKELLFVKKIDEVAEGVYSGSSSYKNDFSWLSVRQLKPLSFGATYEQFFNRIFNNSLGKFTSLVAFEHNWNCIVVFA